MIHVTLSDENLRLARKLGWARSASMGHRDTRNSRNFFQGMPPHWRHQPGAAGEYGFSQLTGYPVDTTTIGRGDSGTDFKDGSNTKCPSPRSGRPSTFMIPDDQFARVHHRPRWRYVLCWVEGQDPDETKWDDILREVRVYGWISVDDFIKLHTGPHITGFRVPTLTCHLQHLTQVRTRSDLMSGSLFD